MSSLVSKDDETVALKDQQPTTGSTDDNQPDTIGSKIVLFQPEIQEQKAEASGTVDLVGESKDLTPTDKNDPGTSKAKDDVILEADAIQPGTSNRTSSGRENRTERRKRSLLGLPNPLKRTSSRLKNISTATANVLEQVDSGRRNPKKRRIALFLEAVQ